MGCYGGCVLFGLGLIVIRKGNPAFVNWDLTVLVASCNKEGLCCTIVYVGDACGHTCIYFDSYAYAFIPCKFSLY